MTAGALDGVVVLDLTRVLGGPYCTQILGDHGAEVIKIEPPQGDEVRDWGPPFDEAHDASYFIGVNRNKRSLGLDLARPEGRDVLLRLLEHADVLIENFKPGSMEKWGLGYEEVLEKRFPRLIHCRISGFGADGPMGGLPGYDAVIQAMVGMFSINGMPGSGDGGPTRIGIPLVDLGTGLYAAIGVLMALLERARSGEGQFLDLALYDAGIALMHPHIPNYLLSGKLPGLTGNAHPNIAPYDKFPTRTVDVFLAVGNDRAFGRLCGELGAPELAEDARFRSNRDRLTNREALSARLMALLADRDGEALCKRLLAIGVPAGPVRDVAQVWSDAHTRHRGMALEQRGYRNFGLPIKLSRTPGRVARTPPRFGAQGREVLEQFGFTGSEIAELIAAGVVLEQRRR
ncbi:MAG TPA: CoA transferase [Geminicoccaceae bacterium]|nr:CoA transferase [Geminicoccaceae bacterium]